MVANIGTHGPKAFGGTTTARPAAVITAYTAHQDHGRNDPPTFVVVGENDGIASARSMQKRAEAMQAQGTEVEMHIIKGMGHGFGTGIDSPAEGWIRKAVEFWEQHIQ